MSISYLYNLQFDENTNTRFAYFFANKTATNASELLLGSGRAANQTSSVSQMSIEQVASGPVAVVANNCLDTALSRSCDCRLVADLTRSRTSDMADEASPGPPGPRLNSNTLTERLAWQRRGDFVGRRVAGDTDSEGRDPARNMPLATVRQRGPAQGGCNRVTERL